MMQGLDTKSYLQAGVDYVSSTFRGAYEGACFIAQKAIQAIPEEEREYVQKQTAKFISTMAPHLASKQADPDEKKAWFVKWLDSLKKSAIGIVSALLNFLFSPFRCP